MPISLPGIQPMYVTKCFNLIGYFCIILNIGSSYVETITEKQFDDIYNNSYHNRKQNFGNLIKHLAFEKVDAFQNAFIVISKYSTNKVKAKIHDQWTDSNKIEFDWI